MHGVVSHTDHNTNMTQTGAPFYVCRILFPHILYSFSAVDFSKFEMLSQMSGYTTTHCDTLQHTALLNELAHCNTIVTHKYCSPELVHCNTLLPYMHSHTTTPCNTLQHSATHALLNTGSTWDGLRTCVQNIFLSHSVRKYDRVCDLCL